MSDDTVIPFRKLPVEVAQKSDIESLAADLVTESDEIEAAVTVILRKNGNCSVWRTSGGDMLRYCGALVVAQFDLVEKSRDDA